MEVWIGTASVAKNTKRNGGAEGVEFQMNDFVPTVGGVAKNFYFCSPLPKMTRTRKKEETTPKTCQQLWSVPYVDIIWLGIAWRTWYRPFRTNWPKRPNSVADSFPINCARRRLPAFCWLKEKRKEQQKSKEVSWVWQRQVISLVIACISGNLSSSAQLLGC